MDNTFNGKNILVVGGSSGIGHSLVELLTAKGAVVYNVSRSAASDWGDNVRHQSLDITGDLSPLKDFVPETLHGFVYCIGSITLKPFNRITKEDLLKDYQLNVIGAVQLIQEALPSLKKAGPSSIVLISSVAAGTGMPYHASIASAKSGVLGLVLSLASEFASQQIRVNAVSPSLTDTPLSQSLLNTEDKRASSAKRHPLGRYGQPADIANAISFLLSEHSSWITGQVLGVDGGMGNLKNG